MSQTVAAALSGEVRVSMFDDSVQAGSLGDTTGPEAWRFAAGASIVGSANQSPPVPGAARGVREFT